MPKNQKVLLYTRDREANKNAPYATKFESFIKAVAEAKATGSALILVAEPWVIGDTYEEVIESLSHLAGTDIGLQIVGGRPALWKN